MTLRIIQYCLQTLTASDASVPNQKTACSFATMLLRPQGNDAARTVFSRILMIPVKNVIDLTNMLALSSSLGIRHLCFVAYLSSYHEKAINALYELA